MRTTPAIRSAVEAAAKSSGRSLTQEVEHRIELSFQLDAMRNIVREELALDAAGRHLASDKFVGF